MAFFSDAVKAFRLDALKAAMRAADVDAVALLSADFIQYATNFHVDVLPWERPIVTVVTADGAIISLMNELSTNHLRYAKARGTLWSTKVETYPEHPRGDGALMVDDWPRIVAGLLQENGLAAARIGVDAPTGLWTKAMALLPQAQCKTITGALRQCRWVKHPEELVIMRELADLTDWVQDRYREEIRPGRVAQEMDAHIAYKMTVEGARRFPGRNLEIVRCKSVVGGPACSPHGDGAPNGVVINAGDVLINLVIPRLDGLFVENERTWFCGRPDAEKERLFHVAGEANLAAIEAARTGKPLSGIDQAALGVINKAGCGGHVYHRTGHGMGIMMHEYPEDMGVSSRPLLADEVYSVEPGLYVFGVGGFRQDDTVIIGDTPEVITHSPKDLKSQTVL